MQTHRRLPDLIQNLKIFRKNKEKINEKLNYITPMY
jgi:hypothetical protein